MKKVLIIIVVFIFIVLFFPMIDGTLVDTKADYTQSDLNALGNLTQRYHDIHHRFPENHEGLSVLIKEGLTPKVPKDPWNKSYQFLLLNKNQCQLCSFGPNSVDNQGKEDDICLLINNDT